MMTAESNGWEKYQKLVLTQLKELKEAVKELTSDLKDRHVPPCAQILVVGEDVGKLKVKEAQNREGVHFLKRIVIVLITAALGLAGYVLFHAVRGG
jgi:hypothetical protein